jgi:hypothetical protein
MKIEPKSGPTIPTPVNTSLAGRERAIAILTGQASGQSAPVANANSVAPEELSAVKPQETGRINSSESSTESVESVAAEKPETAKEDPISTQYANLARKEKQLRARVRQQEEALKAKEAAITAKEAELKAKESEYSSKYISKDRLTQDTINALAEAGLTYDQITELMLNQPDVNKAQQLAYEKKLEAKLKEIEDKQLELQKKSESQQTEAYRQAVAQIKSDTKRLVDSSEEFETVRETNSVDDVVELIERTFQKDGILLTVEEAAKQVEEYLVEEAFKLTKLKKIQQRLAPAEKQAEPKQEPTKQPSTMKTLTNAVAASGKLSARDRAIAAFKGDLK